jgi:uncharacterized repeat protein (TIGR03803 family)
LDVIYGANPQNNGLLLADNNLLYGLTASGGTYNGGVLFRYDPVAGNCTKLVNFDSVNGSYPVSSLMQARNGKLYGTTASGGNNNVGVLFSFDPTTNTYAVLYHFSIATGYSTTGDLVQLNDGKLYGTTMQGGPIGYGGIIFSFNPVGNIFVVLYDFDTLGYSPNGTLALADDGKLYGVTKFGNEDSQGFIFSFDTGSHTYTNLYAFVDTATPTGLIQANNHKLYGTTSGGAFVEHLFSFDLNGNIFTNLHTFPMFSGEQPSGKLLQASDGKLYGTTGDGGANNQGMIFSFDPGTNIFSDFFDCSPTGNNGQNPAGTLIETSGPTGIHEITTDLFRVYPNPASDVVTVCTGNTSAIGNIKVTDINSKEIIYTDIKSTNQELRISGLAQGVYFITVMAGGESATQKLIINR